MSIEARNAAMTGARLEGLTLGEWLDRAIRQQRKAERSQPVGLTIEETLTKLAESLAKQAEATQQQNTAVLARLEVVEQRKEAPGHTTSGNLLGRLYGLLRRSPPPMPTG